MKHKILKPLILLFSVFLIFTNCQKDDDFKDTEISTKSNIKLNKLTLKDLQQKDNLQQSLKKLSKSFDVNKSKANKDGSFSKIDADDGSFTILTDKILQVTTDSTETYSFQIETPTLETSEFENFIIDVKNDSISYLLYC